MDVFHIPGKYRSHWANGHIPGKYRGHKRVVNFPPKLFCVDLGIAPLRCLTPKEGSQLKTATYNRCLSAAYI